MDGGSSIGRELYALDQLNGPHREGTMRGRTNIMNPVFHELLATGQALMNSDDAHRFVDAVAARS